MNAVFITDANALVKPGTRKAPFDVRKYYRESTAWSAEEVVEAANAQGAFVFWNHSRSSFPNAMSAITGFHREAAASGKLHGIEIANGHTYSPESFQIALDFGLTPIGVSDVHDLIDWDYELHKGDHRPVTLVFAKTRASESIREALLESRTVDWFRNLLIGREEHLMPLLEASIRIGEVNYIGEESVLEFVLSNTSDAAFELENLTDYTLVLSHNILIVPPHSIDTYLIRTVERMETVDLRFKVLNALTDPNTHPVISSSVQQKAPAAARADTINQ